MYSGCIWCLLTGFLPSCAAASIYLFKPPYAIGSVPSLSGQAFAYRWRSLSRVRRRGASKPQGTSERVLPWQVTVDQLIIASLSQTHYWDEVGMLKVPAVVYSTLLLVFRHGKIRLQRLRYEWEKPHKTNSYCLLFVDVCRQCRRRSGD